jgi:S-adenosylmethionine hydrolase
MTAEQPIITLLSDFGLNDPYLGAMRGVILSICPKARLVNLAHEITPHQILEGAVALEAAYHYFPAGTIHLAVVDPGVGTERRAIACQSGDWFFVAPDNGLLTSILQAHRNPKIVSLENPVYHLPKVSRTFAGRDIFAPAAAHLANAVPLKDFGPVIKDPVMLDLPRPLLREKAVEAHILYIDRFGNCITDLRETEFERWQREKGRRDIVVRAGEALIRGLSQAYGEAPAGKPLALFSSSGRLEIALNQGSAARLLRLSVGDAVKIVAV